MKEIQKLWEDLQSKLTALDKEGNSIKKLELSRKAAKEAMGKLEEFFHLRSGFEDNPSALGEFNRNLAPPFYSKFIFFSKVSAFECLKADMDIGECEQLCEVELAGIGRFFRQHREFRDYYLKGSTDRDVFYFQDVSNNTLYLDELVTGISPAVNYGCLLMAYMQAFEAYRAYLTSPTPKEQTGPTIDPDLYWPGSPSNLIEVVISLYGYIYKGNQPATIKEITQAFGSLLHVNLSNSSQLDNKRRHTADDGNFLMELAAKYKKRKEELSENQKSRKRRG